MAINRLWRARAEARRVLALLEVAADAADRELEPRLDRLGRRLAAGLALAAATLSFARHDDCAARESERARGVVRGADRREARARDSAMLTLCVLFDERDETSSSAEIGLGRACNPEVGAL